MLSWITADMRFKSIGNYYPCIRPGYRDFWQIVWDSVVKSCLQRGYFEPLLARHRGGMSESGNSSNKSAYGHMETRGTNRVASRQPKGSPQVPAGPRIHSAPLLSAAGKAARQYQKELSAVENAQPLIKKD
jgi:hypothetical protein